MAHCRAVDHDVVKKSPAVRRPGRRGAATLMASMTQTRLERGDVLFHEGDQGDRLYVIGEGKIKLGRTQRRRPREPPGDPRPGRDVRRAEPVRPRPAHATATAVAETQLLGHRPRRPQRFLLDGRPGVAKVAARGPGPAAAPHQREPRRPGLHRRPRPRRQGAARPVQPASAAPSRRASSSPTTSPRRSSPSWSAPPARRSTRPWPTSPRRGWLRLEARAVLLLDVERLKRRAR